MTDTILPRPAWADPALSDDTSTVTMEGRALAVWAALLATSDKAQVYVTRTDVEKSSGIEQGDIVMGIDIATEERVNVRSASELRQIAATLLDAADALDEMHTD